MRFWAVILTLMTVAVASLSVAQDAGTPQVLVIDRDRLFVETRYGQRLAADLQEQAATLQAENDRIVDTLTLEERSLTVRRQEMTVDAFEIATEAFDAKVEEVRKQRDAKVGQLQIQNAERRAEFEARAEEIIGQIIVERGAALVLDERTVVFSVPAANITDEAIARIDAELGDGAEQTDN